MAGQPAPPAPRLDPGRHARLLRRRPQLGQQPADPQVRRRAARRRRRRGQRPRPVHPGRRARHGHLPRLRLLRDRRARVHGAAAQRPPRDPAARLRAAQPGHRRERPQHGRARADPLPRAAHPRPPRPPGAHQVRQPAARWAGRRALPARGHDHQGRRHRARGRRRRVPAEPRVAAPARRAHALDQRRLAVPVDHAGRRAQPLPLRARAWSTSPTCGSTRRAGR